MVRSAAVGMIRVGHLHRATIVAGGTAAAVIADLEPGAFGLGLGGGRFRLGAILENTN